MTYPEKKTRTRGAYHLYGKSKKFWLENQMARAIPFGELQKIWAVI